MNFILDFLRQKAPNSGKEMPVYYRKALRVTAVLLTVYFLASFTWFGLAGGWSVKELAAMYGVSETCIRRIRKRRRYAWVA